MHLKSTIKWTFVFENEAKTMIFKSTLECTKDEGNCG